MRARFSPRDLACPSPRGNAIKSAGAKATAASAPSGRNSAAHVTANVNHSAFAHFGSSRNRAIAHMASASMNSVGVSVSGAAVYEAVNGQSAASQSVASAAPGLAPAGAMRRTKAASSRQPSQIDHNLHACRGKVILHSEEPESRRPETADSRAAGSASGTSPRSAASGQTARAAADSWPGPRRSASLR